MSSSNRKPVVKKKDDSLLKNTNEQRVENLFDLVEQVKINKSLFTRIEKNSFIPHKILIEMLKERTTYLGERGLGCVAELEKIVKTKGRNSKTFNTSVALKTNARISFGKETKGGVKCEDLFLFYKGCKDAIIYEIITTLMGKEKTFVLPIQNFFFSDTKMICNANDRQITFEPTGSYLCKFFTTSPLALVPTSQASKVDMYLGDKELLYMTFCLVWWFAAAHQKGIYHLDFKPDNLSMDLSSSSRLKKFTINEYECSEKNKQCRRIPGSEKSTSFYFNLPCYYSPMDKTWKHFQPLIANFDISSYVPSNSTENQQETILNKIYKSSELGFMKFYEQCTDVPAEILDTGFQNLLKKDAMLVNFGTLFYLPPEAMFIRKYNQKLPLSFAQGCDLWSLGLSLLEIYFKKFNPSNLETLSDLYLITFRNEEFNRVILMKFAKKFLKTQKNAIKADKEVNKLSEKQLLEKYGSVWHKDNIFDGEYLSDEFGIFMFGLYLSYWAKTQYEEMFYIKHGYHKGRFILKLDHYGKNYDYFVDFFNHDNQGHYLFEHIMYDRFVSRNSLPEPVMDIIQSLLTPSWKERTNDRKSHEVLLGLLIKNEKFFKKAPFVPKLSHSSSEVQLDPLMEEDVFYLEREIKSKATK